MRKLPTLELNGDFKYTLDILENTTKSMFITGRAGTGKSTLLKLFRNTTRKKIVVVAPTGIAALNVGGQTIHSFFGFPPRIVPPEEITKRRNHKLYKKIDILVIDEISMVRADMLDNIDRFLRNNRENPVPFGGCQVVFFGDLFQLPPVVSSDVERQLMQFHYESPYFFSARALNDFDFDLEYLELRKVYRQEERHFLRLLDAVRLNQADYEDLDDLNEQYDPLFSPQDYYITLSARNAKVDKINTIELGKLDTEPYTYIANISGDFKPNNYPTAPTLKLKMGAQVMFIKNDPEGAFVNGSIGKIVDLGRELIKVSVEQKDGSRKTIEVIPDTWEAIKYKMKAGSNMNEVEAEVVGSFEQYPLKLAWAITIHKSQGKTFDKVIIDMGKKGAFEHGQTYVALSRCRTLGGIILKNKITPKDIQVDPQIVEFYESRF